MRVYCNGRSVIIRRLTAPFDASIYGDHAYQATVARFSPNGEWVASADVSGIVRFWSRHDDHVLKNKFHVLSGCINDLRWLADGQHIVATSNDKGKVFVRAFMGWLCYLLVAALVFVAIFILLTRICNRGRPIDEVKVIVPPAMNTMEQLLALQNAIFQVEGIVQDVNIMLLKLRALLLAVPSQMTDSAIVVLVLVALILAFLPSKLMILVIFLEIFTRNSPPRRASTNRNTRRLREWWFSIPAAPVVLERDKEEKKRRR